MFLFPSTFDTNGLVVREAVANSLAAVLIRNSCAAEGIVNGVNGFLIDENVCSLYQCLSDLHDNKTKMHSVGICAGEQLYLSWKDAVQNALERYQIVSERYKSGQCKSYRKPAEYFLKANGELMENLDDLLVLREHLFEHIRDKNANNRK